MNRFTITINSQVKKSTVIRLMNTLVILLGSVMCGTTMNAEEGSTFDIDTLEKKRVFDIDTLGQIAGSDATNNSASNLSMFEYIENFSFVSKDYTQTKVKKPIRAIMAYLLCYSHKWRIFKRKAQIRASNLNLLPENGLQEVFLKLIRHIVMFLLHLYNQTENIKLVDNLEEEFEGTESITFQPVLVFFVVFIGNLRKELILQLFIHTDKFPIKHKRKVRKCVEAALQETIKFKLEPTSKTFFEDLFSKPDIYFLHLIVDLDYIIAMRTFDEWIDYIKKGGCFPKYRESRTLVVFRHIFLICLINKLKKTILWKENNEEKEIKFTRLKWCKNGFEDMVSFILLYPNFQTELQMSFGAIEICHNDALFLSEEELSDEQKFYLCNAYIYVFLDYIFSCKTIKREKTNILSWCSRVCNERLTTETHTVVSLALLMAVWGLGN